MEIHDHMGVLHNLYGGSIPDPLRVAVTRWGSDPFALGSYSHIPVGATYKDYDAWAEPLAEGRFLTDGYNRGAKNPLCRMPGKSFPTASDVQRIAE